MKSQFLGQQIRRYRKKAGMSQSALATEVGVSVTAVSYYEKGLREPNFEMINRISAVLGVAVEVLLGLIPTEKESAYNIENAILRVSRKLNLLGKDRLLEYANSLCDAPKYVD